MGSSKKKKKSKKKKGSVKEKLPESSLGRRGVSGLLPWLDVPYPPSSSIKKIEDSFEHCTVEQAEIAADNSFFLSTDREATLEDAYMWFSEGLMQMPINEAAMIFFGHLQHCNDSDAAPSFSDNAKSFVYDLLSRDELLNDDEREALEFAGRCALLFMKNEDEFEECQTENISYFAIEICSAQSDRSYLAHDLHLAISKCVSSHSVVLFQNSNSYLLSLCIVSKDMLPEIVVADWISPTDPVTNQIDRLSAAHCSAVAPTQFLEDLAYNAARSYLIYPETRIYLRYEVIAAAYGSYSGHSLSSREEFFELVESYVSDRETDYGTDYVYWDRRDYDEDDDSTEIDFDLVELDMDIQIGNDEIDDDDDYEDEYLGIKTWQSKEEVDDDPLRTVPQDVFDDPIKLLDWIIEQDNARDDNLQLNNEKPDIETQLPSKQAVFGSHSVASDESHVLLDTPPSRTAESQLIDLLEAASIRFEDNRKVGGLLWLIGGIELAAAVHVLADYNHCFVFVPERENGNPGWYLD